MTALYGSIRTAADRAELFTFLSTVYNVLFMYERFLAVGCSLYPSISFLETEL